ncbi:MAG TPA: alpha/beta fold hydrolase [Candidatus Corynebacterium gallistercoris]|uniref:Alpha/beta fold hydrolase n=1 Tax=Candidatus Corynebacterium gallistercoris TaxID=2838530 RepID=A0A9D1RY27_9CORY|nr:alpha/beta fold hydrolase [Candidatus Corynebacterium gallistercoris]
MTREHNTHQHQPDTNTHHQHPNNSTPNTENLVTEEITFTTADGHQLKGHLIAPGEPAEEAVASPQKIATVMHPATGVNQHLYRKFAEYLATKGWPTLIYDLRGSGLSAQPQDNTDKTMKMSDWILKDVPAATAYLKSRYPDHRHVAIGHSVGAHGMIAIQDEQPVDAMVMIAAHAGITKLISTAAERAKIWVVFNLVTPLTARTLGYVPVEKLGIGKQIPVGVMKCPGFCS